jgi:hypothetical protein
VLLRFRRWKKFAVVKTGLRRRVRIPVSSRTAAVLCACDAARSRSAAFHRFSPGEFVGIVEFRHGPVQAFAVANWQLVQETPVGRETFQKFGRRAQLLQ